MLRHAALPASVLVLFSLAACGQRPSPQPGARAPATTATTAVVAAPASSPASPAPGTSTSPSPAATATEKPLAGTQYAFLTTVDTGKKTITFDLVEWFEGAKATAACKEDGEAITGDSEWCTGYYYRNNNKKLRMLALASGAELTVVDMGDGGVKMVPATLSKFKASLDATHHLFKFDVVDGVITKAEEVYTP